jgi:hypothetical protein
MTTAIVPPAESRQPRLVRVAVKVFSRGPAVVSRKWRMRVLQSNYRRGSRASAVRVIDEEADPTIVETGRELREQLLAVNECKHAAVGYRVLMVRPPSITAEIWFGDLQRCMQFAGIECLLLPPDTPTASINAAFESLRPNVLIATESSQSLHTLDLPFIQRYKRKHGCLRMLNPVWHSKSPTACVPPGRCTPEEDEWRRRLAWSGLLADAHFSIFEPEFHERFSHDPQGPAVDYVTIPQALNPFTDYPLAAAKRYDYMIATSMTDERVEVSHRYLCPILKAYRGLWAGPRWGFGEEQGIAPAEMPLHYAQTRIALSPLVGFVHHYAAELTHRVYAAAGCGAFQLTMPTAITGRYFRPDELLHAGTPAEYARLFDHYVDRPLERNAIALAALRRAYSEHTCFHRIDKLVTHWDGWRRRGLF